jgi:poly-gamma-glutamate capsule biosynthesis protein CapA/YwtB (metallophosphatase superfamily)
VTDDLPPLLASLDLLFTGDLVLDVPAPDHWLSGIAPATRAAHLTVGHLEVPHTLRGVELPGDVPAPGADPDHLAALRRAGFRILTLAGNHIADCGADGIADTCGELDRLAIAHCGAGSDLLTAKAPAVAEGVLVLSYNCVGPEAGWATASRAGCAHIRIDTADGAPISPSAALSRPDELSLTSMMTDVAEARRSGQLVVVALHKGIVHTPAKLAPYERTVAHAAVDAGADIVVSHHAHIIRGIEIYAGRPIFHGLGNGCVVTHALSPNQSHPGRAAWAERRKRLFGFEPDPAYELAPFHPEAVHAMLGHVRRLPGGALETGFVPIFVEPPGRPVIADEARGRAVMQYVERITREADLPPLRQQWRDGLVVLS